MAKRKTTRSSADQLTLDAPELGQTLSPIANRKLDAAAEQRQSPLDLDAIYGDIQGDRQYLHVVLAQCGMPYRQPPPQTQFYEKRNGNTSLVLTPGVLFDPKTNSPVMQGIPYGAKPRLLMIHLCTQAVLHQSPVVEIGASMSAFMQDLGLAVTGGKTGSIGRFKDQLNRLAATRMQLLNGGEGKSSMRNLSSPISQYDVWFPKDPSQRILWPTEVTLSTEFYNNLNDENAVPLDPRAIKGLQQSAMSLDIYTWLAHRLWRIPIGKPSDVPWDALQRQFGPDNKDPYSFRKDFKESLKDVLGLYRGANVELSHGGVLRLRHSRPPVAPATLSGRK